MWVVGRGVYVQDRPQANSNTRFQLGVMRTPPSASTVTMLPCCDCSDRNHGLVVFCKACTAPRRPLLNLVLKSPRNALYSCSVSTSCSTKWHIIRVMSCSGWRVNFSRRTLVRESLFRVTKAFIFVYVFTNVGTKSEHPLLNQFLKGPHLFCSCGLS